MTRKRAPGGGRKPEGPFKGKTATLTTRITSELRSALDREAKRNNRSLSQEVEQRLRQSIDQPKQQGKILGAPHNPAFASIVARLAANIELVTGENWRKDAFSFQALKSAIEFAFSKLAPNGPVRVPARIKQTAVGLNSSQSEQFFKPDGVALAVALGFWDQLEIIEMPPLNHPRNVYYAEESYSLPNIRRDLDLKPRKGINQ